MSKFSITIRVYCTAHCVKNVYGICLHKKKTQQHNPTHSNKHATISSFQITQNYYYEHLHFCIAVSGGQNCMGNNKMREPDEMTTIIR